MPQALLPLIPDGSTQINDRISVVCDQEEWTYYCGVEPVFHHPADDRRTFRMYTAQLVCQGLCRQVDIVRKFGVSSNCVKRSVKLFREQGVAGFYQPRRVRGATVLNDEVQTRAQELLSRGCSRRDVADQLGIQYDTLRKAINQGRLHEPTEHSDSNSNSNSDSNSDSDSDSDSNLAAASDKSKRSVDDTSAEMGVGCTRPEERVLAAFGMLDGAPTRFESCRDVSFGGALCGLPALEANGLFEHLSKSFPTLRGYYTTLQVITLLAYMALCRIKTVERLQYEAPGELGKLMGLGACFIPFVISMIDLGIPPIAKATVAIFASVSFVIFFRYYALPQALEKQSRRMLDEGDNDGMFGLKQLELDDEWLTSRSNVIESRHKWSVVKRIDVTDAYAFLYISSIQAHIVPLRNVTHGDPRLFLAKSQALMDSVKR